MTAPHVIGTLPTTTPYRVEPDTAAGVVWVWRSDAQPPQPADWRERLAADMQHLGVSIVGAKRLDAQGKLFAMGDMVIHPKGFHYQGKGQPAQAYRFPEEVDAVSGGVMAVALDDFEAVQGAALCGGELGMLTLCLAVRERGGRCVVVPSVVVEDGHALSPTPSEAQAFHGRFGYEWLAADLDAVAARYTGTPMLWNARYFGTALPFEKYEQRPAMHWTSYQQVEVYRQRADHIAKLVADLCPAGGEALDLGCGDGLFSHLVATRGVTVTGLDVELAAIEQARAQVAAQQYPHQPPTFIHSPAGALPFADGTFDVLFMLDVIEHLPNPLAVLCEAQRVMKPGGAMLITTPAWQFGTWSDATYHVAEYSAEELTRQVNAAGALGHGLQAVNLGSIGGVYRDLVLIARRPA